MKFLSDYDKKNLATFAVDPQRSAGQRKRWDKVGRKNKSNLNESLNNALTASRIFGNVVTPLSSAVRAGTNLGDFIHRITPKQTQPLSAIQKWRIGIADVKQTQGAIFDRGMTSSIKTIIPKPPQAPRQASIRYDVYRHSL